MTRVADRQTDRQSRVTDKTRIADPERQTDKTDRQTDSRAANR